MPDPAVMFFAAGFFLFTVLAVHLLYGCRAPVTLQMLF